MVTIIETILLAIVQGITEWFPISSSGHLVIFQQLFKINVPVSFDVMLHVGTLISVIAIFWRDIVKIIRSIFKFNFKTEEGKLFLYLIIGSIPTAIIGLLFKDFFESLFTNLLAVGLFLIINGFILFFTKYANGVKKLNSYDSIIIGISQGISIIPGISRSGITISAGLLRKLDKEIVIRYSFLLSLLAIIGATLVKSKDLVLGQIPYDITLIGIIISALVGYFALKTVINFLMNKKFHNFAYYCWIVGLLIIIFSFLKIL
jgi:undecaprenyl-diphosphatase